MPSLLTRISAVSLVALASLTLTGCSIGMPFSVGESPIAAAQAAATSTPTPTPTPELVFNSEFSDMGSVHPSTLIGDELDLTLDMWTEQKTHDWTASSEKLFSFVINVFDNKVPADATFANKRTVYMSKLVVTATTSTDSGTSSTPFVLNVDPVAATLDPEAIRSEYGLLITSPKGGFQLESNAINQLPDDTNGLNLDFAMTITSEAASGTKNFIQQEVHISVPVAIFDVATTS